MKKTEIDRRQFIQSTGAITALTAMAALGSPAFAAAKANQNATKGNTEFDALSKLANKVIGQYQQYYEEAHAIHKAGKLKLVSEKVLEPYRGHGFEVKKGQTVRFELIDGPQALDITFAVKSRPTKEFVSGYPTVNLQALSQHEGKHYFTNTPYFRPILTIIKDTVDHDVLRSKYGETACHSWMYPNGRCCAGYYEASFGRPNFNTCDLNLTQGLYEVAGEEVARAQYPVQSVVHFAATAFDKVPMGMTIYSGEDMFKRGDYVEHLVHDDLYVSVSLCPGGDFAYTSEGLEDLVSWPIKVKIFEGVDGPLRTAPDPEYKSMTPIDFIKAGYPDMGKGIVGNKKHKTYFG